MARTIAAPRASTRRKRAAPGRPLAGRVAIVTGSTSGIGLGIARALAAQGCAVVLNGLGDGEAIERERESLARAERGQARYHPADMSRPDQIRELVSWAVSDLGSVDVIVSNAGVQHVAPVESFPDDRWDAILAVNLSAAFHLTKAALPHMRQRGWGRIINIASVHGLVASTNKVAYVTAKHGLVGLTKAVALECADSAITCNAICPGWVRTPLVEAQIAQRAREQGISLSRATEDLLCEKQPSGRFTEVEQLGALVAFLCSDAAANITGATQVVDGGWTAR